ncbi:MAG: hypothetical protein PHH04_02400 [Thomasclavelia sp.]|nr:hypothetical protein [Thomasclavelia sp.]
MEQDSNNAVNNKLDTENDNQYIYHYTSAEAFKQMMEDKKCTFRMTRSEFMNDPADSTVFLDLIEEYLETNYKIINKKIEENTCNCDSVEELKEMYERYQFIDYLKYSLKNLHLYIISFTKSEDKIEFWKDYGKGGFQYKINKEQFRRQFDSYINNADKGKTDIVYCFDTVIYINSKNKSLEDIDKLINKKNTKNSIFSFFKHKKGYNQEEKDKEGTNNIIINYLLDLVEDYLFSLNFMKVNKIADMKNGELEDVFPKLLKNQTENERLSYKYSVFKKFLVLSAMIKDESFKYENEFRLVYVKTKQDAKDEKYDFKTIMNQSCLRPYISIKKKDENDSFDWKKSLKGITISPTSSNVPIDNELYKKVIENFLKAKGVEEVKVECSKIRYRW